MEPMQHERPSVVFVGAGPVGLATACIFKVLTGHKVKLFDQRSEYTRKHALSINFDSINKVIFILTKHICFGDKDVNVPKAKELKAIFSSWNSDHVSTLKIENALSNFAKTLNIKIYRGAEYGVTETLFENLCDNTKNPCETKMQKSFKSAKIIVGSDGFHSVVQQVAMQNRYAYKEEIGHILELKCQVDACVKPLSLKKAYQIAVNSGGICFETLSKNTSEEKKQGSFRLFIDNTNYSNIRTHDSNGELKGVFNNPWSLEELYEASKENSQLERICEVFFNYKKSIEERNGTIENTKISAVPLNIYCSEQGFTEYKDKKVVIVGDAIVSLPLQRGYNAGLKEAVVLALAMKESLNENSNKPLLAYEAKVHKMFTVECAYANFKQWGINGAGKILKKK